MLARRAHNRAHSFSQAPPLSPSSSSPSSPMSPTSPHSSPLSAPALSVPSIGIDGVVSIGIASPGSPGSSFGDSPSAPGRPHTIIPAPEIQKYSHELRRALSVRFEAVAAAGRNALPPPPKARLEDPDYGYDEDPFDTHAKLLMSLDNPLPSVNVVQSNSAMNNSRQPPEESYFDLGSDTELETPSRRWSIASGQSPSYFDGASTPSSEISHFSEASFEAGRASDWISLYGRQRLRTPPATSRRNSVNSISMPPQMLTPLHALRQHAPSPQPSVRRFRRRQHPYDLDSTPSTPPEPIEPPSLARTTSESMLLAAGLASQRERRRVRA